MLLPRFGIRGMLLSMAVCALLAMVVSLAVSGHIWAIAASMGLLALVLAMVGFAMTFGLAELFWLIRRRRGDVYEATPFGGDGPPRPALQPWDPEG